MEIKYNMYDFIQTSIIINFIPKMDKISNFFLCDDNKIGIEYVNKYNFHMINLTYDIKQIDFISKKITEFYCLLNQ